MEKIFNIFIIFVFCIGLHAADRSANNPSTIEEAITMFNGSLVELRTDSKVYQGILIYEANSSEITLMLPSKQELKFNCQDYTIKAIKILESSSTKDADLSNLISLFSRYPAITALPEPKKIAEGFEQAKAVPRTFDIQFAGLRPFKIASAPTKSIWWDKKHKEDKIYGYFHEHNYPIFLVILDSDSEISNVQSARRNFKTTILAHLFAKNIDLSLNYGGLFSADKKVAIFLPMPFIAKNPVGKEKEKSSSAKRPLEDNPVYMHFPTQTVEGEKQVLCFHKKAHNGELYLVPKHMRGNDGEILFVTPELEITAVYFGPICFKAQALDGINFFSCDVSSLKPGKYTVMVQISEQILCLDETPHEVTACTRENRPAFQAQAAVRIPALNVPAFHVPTYSIPSLNPRPAFHVPAYSIPALNHQPVYNFPAPPLPSNEEPELESAQYLDF